MRAAKLEAVPKNKTSEVVLEEGLLPERLNLKKQVEEKMSIEDSKVGMDLNESGSNKGEGPLKLIFEDACRPSTHHRLEAQSQQEEPGPRERIERNTSYEDSINSEASMDLRDSGSYQPKESLTLTRKKHSHAYLEQTNSDETSEAANLADELGCHMKLWEDSDVDQQSFTLERNDASTISETLKGNEKEKSSDGVPCFSDELAALPLSPSNSDFLKHSMEERTENQQPSSYLSSVPLRLVNAKDSLDSSVPLPNVEIGMLEASSSLSAGSRDESTSESILFLEESEQPPPKSDLSTCEADAVSQSILRVRPDSSALENSIEIVEEKVRFDKGAERVESDKENIPQMIVLKIEKEEEKRSGRRRPRPNKQSQPTIYMT